MDIEQFNQYLWLIVNIAIWELIWKSIALWRAAKNDSKGWFIALILINSVGILPILYLYVFGRKKKTS